MSVSAADFAAVSPRIFFEVVTSSLIALVRCSSSTAGSFCVSVVAEFKCSAAFLRRLMSQEMRFRALLRVFPEWETPKDCRL